MFDVKIIAVGKVKNKSYQTLITEYFKRLKPYAKLDLVELDYQSFKSESDKEKVKNNEEKKFLKIIENNNNKLIIALDENGDELDSISFGNFLNDSKQQIIFLIAGTLGFTELIKSKVDKVISLSSMTFPHEMARVILLEQIYRGATIINNKKYHY